MAPIQRESFIAKQPNISKLFLKVSFDFDDLARTWVVKEEANKPHPQKVLIKDSKPGDGNIPFFEVGRTLDYKNKNYIVIGTYLDLQQIANPDQFMKDLVIDYHLVEDDDIPGNFFESMVYHPRSSEMIFSNNNKAVYITKIIEIS